MNRLVALTFSCAFIVATPASAAADGYGMWHYHGPGYAYEHWPACGPDFAFVPGPGYGYEGEPVYDPETGMREGTMAYGMGPGGHIGRMGRIMDQNGDGVLSDDEVASRHEEVFDALDADGDGTLTENEFLAGAASAYRGPRHLERKDRLEQHRRNRFSTMDRNRDGKVSQEEYMAAARDQFRASDLDKDGKVTVWEFRSRRRP